MDPKLISRLDSVEARFEELTAQLSDPATANDSSLYQKTARAQSEHAELVEKYREWKTIQSEIAGAQGMLSESDPEMQAMAKEELAGLETRSTAAVEALKVLLLPADPNDQKNVILEIRAGTGGDEARNPFPQRQQWGVVALIFRAHERPSEFEGGADLQEQLFVITENSVGVQSFDAIGTNDLVGTSRAVRSC